MQNKRGFTLIELLIAISILAILSSIAVVAYSSITIRMRDTRRMRDLEIIKQALELYKGDVHNYPQTVDFVLPNALSNAGMVYLANPPTDPDPNRQYFYLALPHSCDNRTIWKACLNFVLCAKKESSDSSLNLSFCSALPAGSCGTGLTCDMGISSSN